MSKAEVKGIDQGYEAARDDNKRVLAATMAGPKPPLDHAPAEGGKDPEREFEVPARMTASRPSHQAGPSAYRAGNSGEVPADPQGQQGGTLGGSPASPPLPQECHPVANTGERKRGGRSSVRRGGKDAREG